MSRDIKHLSYIPMENERQDGKLPRRFGLTRHSLTVTPDPDSLIGRIDDVAAVPVVGGM